MRCYYEEVVNSRICVAASAIGAGDVSKEVLMDGQATNEGASRGRTAIRLLSGLG